ncbi:UPF0725 protein EMB2204 [Capsella rubella]|uniref:UPF0725 protein EMB2204 n=1 Tax=Capsella rubella TaxID=81985 RepID=UPI000CD53070|nr:UPF0725 protein EMB2204 [Capsella rubella]
MEPNRNSFGFFNKILTTKEPFLRPHSQPVCDCFISDELPDWPSEIDFNDRKRFHLVKESELRDNDWIRLYLELALVFHNRRLTNHQLEIVQVAIETTEDVEPRNSEKTVVVYIKDFAKAQIGEPYEDVFGFVFLDHIDNN